MMARIYFIHMMSLSQAFFAGFTLIFGFATGLVFFAAICAASFTASYALITPPVLLNSDNFTSSSVPGVFALIVAGTALFSNTYFTCCPVSVGKYSIISAATPVVTGAAILVPDSLP